MSGQGSGHKGGQQNHQSQKPLRPLKPSNQAGVPAHAAASTATEPLEDLQGINHGFFKTNGSKNQGLARDILDGLTSWLWTSLCYESCLDSSWLISLTSYALTMNSGTSSCANAKWTLLNYLLVTTFSLKRMRWFWLSRSPEIQFPLGPATNVEATLMSLRFHSCLNVVAYPISMAELAETVSYITTEDSVVSVSCVSRHRAMRITDKDWDNGLAAPQVVFHSKAPVSFTPREDDFIALLRTCIQDTAGNIKKKYFPNRSVPCIAARIYQLSLEKRIPAFKTALWY